MVTTNQNNPPQWAVKLIYYTRVVNVHTTDYTHAVPSVIDPPPRGPTAGRSTRGEGVNSGAKIQWAQNVVLNRLSVQVRTEECAHQDSNPRYRHAGPVL